MTGAGKAEGHSNQVIERLGQQSLEREGAFLDLLAERLGRPRKTTAPKHPFRGAPDFWQGYELTEEQRIELFLQNWKGNGGAAERFATREALAEYIAAEAQRLGARYVVRWEEQLLDSLELETRLPDAELTVWNRDQSVDHLGKAAGADIGIVVADWAIAHTGTVVTVSAAGQGRSVSLLPAAMMAVVRAQDINTRMGEVMTLLHERFGEQLPAGVHFITGPSRSADIENDLTIGVHGPGVVYVLVLDEE